MGQQCGKSSFVLAAKPFVNLEKTAVWALWEAFNDVAEGFGINGHELYEICSVLQTHLGNVSKAAIERFVDAAFTAFDTDENLLVDALEILATLSILSGMDLKSKAAFVFNCYDFDESGELTIDELTLALKSSITGLAKLSGTDPPDEARLERIAQDAFAKNGKHKDHRITKNEFVAYCDSTPEVASWLYFFDDPPDFAAETVPGVDADSDLDLEGWAAERDDNFVAATDPDSEVGPARGLLPEGELGRRDVAQRQAPGKGRARTEKDARKRDAASAYTGSWLNTVENTVPSNPPPIDSTQPDDNTLALQWVHGYSSQKVRSSLRYTSSGEIVYTAACVGVVYTQESHEQRFNLDHTDEIVCLTLHPDGAIVATGEEGRSPKINVWDSGTMRLICTLKGFHKIGVLHLTFSPCGKRLLSTGADRDHSVAVYDWHNKQLLFAARATEAAIYACAFRISQGSSFVTCGYKHISFWNSIGPGLYEQKKGLFGRIGRVQTMLCVASLQSSRTVSGTASGHLYVWDDRNLKKIVKAHDTAVNALYAVNGGADGLVSGGRDGKVRLWSPVLEPGATFDMSGVGSFNSTVRSVCWSDDLSKVLVGTAGAEVYEISAQDGSSMHPGPLVQGHCKLELWGLAVSPVKPEFCTVGDDHTVRVWDLAMRKMVKMVQLDTMARAVAYSPDGTQIAVGLGGGGGKSRQKKDGAFLILNETDLTIVHEARDSKQSITDVKYSPDGATLAIASSDSNIYLYNVEDFASKGKCKGHVKSVTHIDFSGDSQCLQSNCKNYELLFWNATTGEQQKHPSALKDAEWASWTLPLGWPAQGFWPAGDDGIDVLAVDRSKSGQVVACVDNFGRLRLFRYPAVGKGAGFNQYRGHCARTSNVRFSSDDGYVITVGGCDRCVFQWRHEADQAEDDAEEYREEPDSEDEADLLDGTALDRSPDQENANEDVVAFDADDDEEEGEFVAVKPWVGSVVPPSNPPADDPSAPEEGLELQWVHGYRAQESRNNVRYTATGEIVYPAGTLGVVFNTEGGGLQRYFTDHSDDVVSIAVHPEGLLVATGQLGKTPRIIVWNAETTEAVQTLQGFHHRAVSLLQFSRDGRMLVSVGADNDHSIAIYDWQNGSIQSSCKGDPQKVLAIDFTPDCQGIVQAGVNHVKFHQLRGRNIVTKRGLLGKKGKLQPLLTIGWSGNTPVVGTVDGHMYRFEGRQLKQSVKAHTGCVTAMHTCSEGLCTGGKDGKVKLWSTNLDCKAEFDVNALGTSFSPRVRSVCWDPAENKILVGTRGSEIFEISASDGSGINPKGGNDPLLQGHFAHELWGLAAHPIKGEFCTVGDDMTVRVWDVAERRLLRYRKLECMARCVEYSPDGSKIAIGMGGRIPGRGRHKKDGAFMVLNERDLSVAHEGRDSKFWLSECKYSPDGNTLALGSHDNKIYLYDVGAGYTLKGVFEGHNSYITHFDFSADGQYLQSNCGAFELLFSDANSGSSIPAISTLKDVHWATWTCPLGWPVQGIWPEAKHDGTDISSCCRSKSEQVLATTDTFGRLKLYRYPCLTQGAGEKLFRGHSSRVTNVRFTGDDGYMISVGGRDRCVFQWRVLEPEADQAQAAGDSGLDSDVDLEAVFNMDVDAEGDDFVAVKPWVGAVVTPSNPPVDDPSTPHARIELDHIHGYRAQDCRNNLRYTATGDVVYHSAAVGIVYSKKMHRQQFYVGHTSDIVCLAIDPSGRFVATGDAASVPRVHIWNAMTGQLVKTLRPFHTRAVTLVSFAANGSQLVSVGQDNNHTVAVWRTDTGTWADARMQANGMGGQHKLLFCQFLEPEVNSHFQLVTGGVRHVNFWKLKGKFFKPSRGLFGRKGKTQPILCASTIGNRLTTGTVSGHLYVWEGHEVTKSIKAHEKSVNAMHACTSGLITGSKDGIVKLWDTRLAPMRTFNIAEADPTPHVAYTEHPHVLFTRSFCT